MVLGNSNSPYLKELLYFKESLSVLLISILFILLAANINMSELMLIYNWNTAILFAIVVFIIRPIGVFISTYNSSLKLNEKLFISWVGPRGIVAAGIASLFGLKLAKSGVVGAEYITPLVFTIVLGTVLLNATTARLFARVIGVFLQKSEGILIVGASKLSRIIAKYLTDNNRHVVLIDSNLTNVKKAKEIGLEAINANIYSESLTDNIELNDVGYLMALTGNNDINNYVIDKFKNQFGENGSFRLITSEEKIDDSNNPIEGLFSHTDDYTKLSEIVKRFPLMHEINLKSKEHYQSLLELTNTNTDIVPVFIKSGSGVLEIIPASNKEVKFEKNSKLVYLGKQLNETENSL